MMTIELRVLYVIAVVLLFLLVVLCLTSDNSSNPRKSLSYLDEPIPFERGFIDLDVLPVPEVKEEVPKQRDITGDLYLLKGLGVSLW